MSFFCGFAKIETLVSPTVTYKKGVAPQFVLERRKKW